MGQAETGESAGLIVLSQSSTPSVYLFFILSSQLVIPPPCLQTPLPATLGPQKGLWCLQKEIPTAHLLGKVSRVEAEGHGMASACKRQSTCKRTLHAVSKGQREHACTHVCVCVSKHMYVCVYICIFVCVCECV